MHQSTLSSRDPSTALQSPLSSCQHRWERSWSRHRRKRARNKKRKAQKENEGKWRESTRLAPASPSLSTPAPAGPANTEPWMVGQRMGDAPQRCPRGHNEPQTCPEGDVLPGHRLVPAQGRRREVTASHHHGNPRRPLRCSHPNLQDEPRQINNPSRDRQGWAGGPLLGG